MLFIRFNHLGNISLAFGKLKAKSMEKQCESTYTILSLNKLATLQNLTKKKKP